MSLELNHRIYGEGDPVIILHGLFGMLDNWHSFAKLLAEEYMVITVDQRDHGKSPHTDAFNYKLLAEDLAHFLEANWIHEARVIGHSMGGKTAMQLATDYPDIIEQLVVVDIAPVAYNRGHDEIFEALFAVDIDTVTSRSEVEDTLADFISDNGVRQFLMKNLQRKKEGGYRWKMNLPLLHTNYHHIIDDIGNEEPIDVPTLFIKGENSNYIVKEGEEIIKQRYAEVDIKTIDGSGHWVHAEKPTELLEAVRVFFKNDK